MTVSGAFGLFVLKRQGLRPPPSFDVILCSTLLHGYMLAEAVVVSRVGSKRLKCLDAFGLFEHLLAVDCLNDSLLLLNGKHARLLLALGLRCHLDVM